MFVLCLSRGRMFQNNSDRISIQVIEVAFPLYLCHADILTSRVMASDLCYIEF